MENKRENKIIVVPVTIVLVFIFSYIGCKQLYPEATIAGIFYSTLSFFTLENVKPEEVTVNFYITIAKYLAALLLGIGIYNLVYAYFNRQYKILKIKYGYKKHVVIFSMKMVGPDFIADLIANRYKVILVEDDADNPDLEKIEKQGVIVFRDKEYDTRFFDTLVVSHATACVVAFDNDALNIELALNLVKYLGHKAHKQDVKVLTHIEEHNNLEVIRDYVDVTNADENFDLETFNIFSAAAKKIYDHFPPHHYFDFDDDDDENAIAVVGYNAAAEEFIIENLVLSHYKGCTNIKIYLVDGDADGLLHHFLYQYPYSKEFIDIIPVKLLNNKFFANFNYSKAVMEKLSKVKAAYFFGDKGAELINNAARFRQFLTGQTTNYLQTPIIICFPEDTGLMNLLDVERENGSHLTQVFGKHMNISVVNMIKDTCTSSRLLEEGEHIDLLSRVINYYYSVKYEFEHILKGTYGVQDPKRVIQTLEDKFLDMPHSGNGVTERDVEEMVLQTIAKETGRAIAELKLTFSIKKWWDHLSYHKKSANRYAARHLSVKIEIMKHIGCLPLTRENIVNAFPVIAPIEHKRWSAEKMALNYRYGALPQDRVAKNIAKDVLKIHDQLIPYEKLDDENKEKDLNIFLLMPLLNSLKVDHKK
jgi:Trk K+ transport system NAD-binding subunit